MSCVPTQKRIKVPSNTNLQEKNEGGLNKRNFIAEMIDENILHKSFYRKIYFYPKKEHTHRQSLLQNNLGRRRQFSGYKHPPLEAHYTV